MMKFREEHVPEWDMEGSFTTLNAESVEGTMGFVIYSLRDSP